MISDHKAAMGTAGKVAIEQVVPPKINDQIRFRCYGAGSDPDNYFPLIVTYMGDDKGWSGDDGTTSGAFPIDGVPAIEPEHPRSVAELYHALAYIGNGLGTRCVPEEEVADGLDGS